jgi:hypothetical protein
MCRGRRDRNYAEESLEAEGRFVRRCARRIELQNQLEVDYRSSAVGGAANFLEALFGVEGNGVRIGNEGVETNPIDR